MIEGLSAIEAGNGPGEHGDRDKEEREKKLNKSTSLFEAALLALVAVLAAYSGWAAAKWSTESSLRLATASADRAKAAAANLDALNSLNFDLATFNDWFSASVVGNTTAVAIAEKRFSPNFDRAFEAWLATNPETNPDAPPGPTYMPQYHQPAKVLAATLNVGNRRLLGRGEGGGQRRRLRPHYRLPGDGPLPRRHREPLRFPCHPLHARRRRVGHPHRGYRLTGHRAQAAVKSSKMFGASTGLIDPMPVASQFSN